VPNRPGETDHVPLVVVLTEDGEPLLPGLDPVADVATLHHVTDRASLAEHLPHADVLLVTDFRRPLLREAWPKAGRLRWIHATSAGIDALLFPALVDSAIPVTNARGIFDGAIAEFVLGQILAFAKDLPESVRMNERRVWRHRETERIEGRHVLVVGAGSIGRRIGRLLGAAGMSVAGVARRQRDDSVFGTVQPIERLHDLLGAADFVVLATPLTPETKGLIAAPELRAMKPSARLINIARGAVVVADDLVAALRSGTIAGAALDVFDVEPLPADHPFYEMPQVIVTAHMAGDFIGWREALARQFIDNFERWRRGHPLENVVDKRLGYGARILETSVGSRHD
jgi:phosphoglycerate dehydrogenase-like enzyme